MKSESNNNLMRGLYNSSTVAFHAAGEGSNPIPSLQTYKNGIIKEITKKEAKSLIEKYHYLGAKGFRTKVNFGLFLNGGSECVGACIFHGVSVPETVVGAFGLKRTEQDGIFELGRLVLKSELNGSNWGSFLIGKSIKFLRKKENVRAIISYAESTRHTGAIYQASNFSYCGLTASKSDYYVDGKIKERGKTKGVSGEWKPRPRKHRYVLLFDANLKLKWNIEKYPKK